MYKTEDFKEMVFIDIETTPAFKTYEEMCIARPGAIEHWAKKAQQHRGAEAHLSELTDAEMYIEMAALSPEFGKVRVISIGQVKFDENGVPTDPKIRSFYGDDEFTVLTEFMQTSQGIFNASPDIKFVGHNIKNFDFPFLIKRALINGTPTPHQLHFQKKKPWENCLLDTYDVWKFGGWGSASLDLICDSLEIPSPKTIMKASSTGAEYWNGNLEKVKLYCEDDVKATMNVMLKLSYMQII